ncbi:MAG: LamG domain-containing protein [Candidatus Parvarchaeota archaeon]|nr:LamG domain-containing protein [Candidatus Parvarchaeota archaeon]
MSLPRRSQSALEYMMTYGWAILVIVIVAGVLYSLGIFSPSSSLSTTITGFSGLGVTQAGCVNSVNNQILELYVTNTVGYPVNITKINTTGNNGIDVSQNIGSILNAGDSAVFYVNGACNKSSSYAGSATITYTEPGQALPGPYLSSGKIANVPVTTNSNLVGNFNPALSSRIINSNPKSMPTGDTISIVAWIKPINPQSVSTYNYVFAYGAGYYTGCGTYTTVGLGIQSDMYPVVANWCNDFIPNTGSSFQAGVWNMDSVVISGDSANLYVGSSQTSGTLANGQPANIQTGPLGIGIAGNPPIGWGAFNGSIADVQVYSTALSSQQISYLYSEGLGGAPLSDAGLVGWWPLDGNANDYSGNNNNGAATNVNWVSP